MQCNFVSFYPREIIHTKKLTLKFCKFQKYKFKKIQGCGGWFDKHLVKTFDGKLQQGWKVWI